MNVLSDNTTMTVLLMSCLGKLLICEYHILYLTLVVKLMVSFICMTNFSILWMILSNLHTFFCNRSLYLLIKKHQDTWQRVVNMDKQLYNPERLFQNRGAQLLQEERDRRAAQKVSVRSDCHNQSWSPNIESWNLISHEYKEI